MTEFSIIKMKATDHFHFHILHRYLWYGKSKQMIMVFFFTHALMFLRLYCNNSNNNKNNDNWHNNENSSGIYVNPDNVG